MDKLTILQRMDEKTLTNKIIIPLMKKMDFEDVIYTHGIDEYGRDIIFSSKDGFSDHIWWASQIKACDIHGTSSRDEGNVTEINRQIDMAFSQPYFVKEKNIDVYINQFVLITSGKFTGNSKEIIRERFKQKPIKFFDGNFIVSLLEKHKLENLLSSPIEKHDEMGLKEFLLDTVSKEKNDYRALFILDKISKSKLKIKFTSSEIKKINMLLVKNMLDEYYHAPKNTLFLRNVKNDTQAIKFLINALNRKINCMETYSNSKVEEVLKILINVINLSKKVGIEKYMHKVKWETLFIKIQESMPRIKYEFERNMVLFRFYELAEILPESAIKKSYPLDNDLRLMLYMLSNNLEDAQRIVLSEHDSLKFFSSSIERLLSIHISTSLQFATYDQDRVIKIMRLIKKFTNKKEFIKNFGNKKSIYESYQPKYRILFYIFDNNFTDYSKLLKQTNTYDEYERLSRYSLIKITKILLRKKPNSIIENIPNNLETRHLKQIIQDMYALKEYDGIEKIIKNYQDQKLLYNDYWGADILDYFAIVLTKKGKCGEAKNIFDNLKNKGHDITWKYYDVCNKK